MQTVNLRYASAMSIAKDPLPQATIPALFRVLDVGCGAGDSLQEELEARRKIMGNDAQIEMVGIDIDEEALDEGKVSYPHFHFVRGQGEHLPFADESFDLVISRVALPYMDIPVALRQIHRVLKPGGELRLKLHPFTFTLHEIKSEIASGPIWKRAQRFLYRTYVLANGIVLHLAGVNFRFPLARRRCESFQTKSGMHRALTAAGFRSVEIPAWDTQIVWPHAGNCRAISFRNSERSKSR